MEKTILGIVPRHIHHYTTHNHPIEPSVVANQARYQRLAKQLEDLDVPFVEDFPSALKSTDHIVDAIFGMSRRVVSCLQKFE